MRRPRYYDRQGRPIEDIHRFARLHMDPRYKILRKTQVGPDVEISTVWLGSDHQFGDGPPLIFETMVFGGERDDDTFRYSSEKQAMEGHERVVAELAAVLRTEPVDTTEQFIAEHEDE